MYTGCLEKRSTHHAHTARIAYAYHGEAAADTAAAEAAAAARVREPAGSADPAVNVECAVAESAAGRSAAAHEGGMRQDTANTAAAEST